MTNEEKKTYLKDLFDSASVGNLVDNSDAMKTYLFESSEALKSGDVAAFKQAIEKYYRETTRKLYEANPDWGPLPEKDMGDK